MNKAQLVKLIYYKNTSLGQEIIQKAVECILNELATGARNQTVAEIRHFGTFSSRPKKKRTLIHPATQLPVVAEAYRYMHYAYSKKAADSLDNTNSAI